MGKKERETAATSAVTPARAHAQAEGEAAAAWVPLASLKAWARNPRRNEAAVPQVVESIKRFGFASPIIARQADGEIIAGHTRAKAAEVLGLDRVPVRFLDLDPADAHLLALADNKLNEKADWDSAEVASILSEYGLDDAALAGWDAAELDKLASSLAGGGLGAGTNDPTDEWDGMPEFVQEDKTAFRTLIVHFKSQEHVDEFAELVGQKVTEKTKSIWFPEAEIERYADKRYASAS